MEKQNNHIDRRGFLKIVGISAATTTAALYGCGSGTKSSQGRNASSPVPTDQMTYRSVGGIKDKVSLLGYGCMRWPTVPSPEGKGDLINQEAVNELVDYAIAHGGELFRYITCIRTGLVGKSNRYRSQEASARKALYSHQAIEFL